MQINSLLSSVNIADNLEEDVLKKMGTDCFAGYEQDLKSRAHWETEIENWTKLAIQVRENKSYPWPNASNIKFPLLSTAAMQFNARAYPTIIPSDGKPVKCRVVGSDPQGLKASRALRISEHMSYQLMEEMDGWDEDMDRLLMILPIVGTVFKKTWYDQLCKCNKSELVLPKDLVVNYWTKKLEDAARKTQRIYLTKNEVQERINAKLFLDIDLTQASVLNHDEVTNTVNRQLTENSDEDETTPYLFLEQHTTWDLDDDGYREPYIITFEYSTRKIVRIVARFDEEGIELDDEGEILRIVPVEYFTKYGFIPNPDGGFYDLGFGILLGALNESVNTIVNQLVDAGSLSNLQSGFLAKGLRLKLGETRFQPGEWKAVNATGDDLRKSIYPLPVRDPSPVLFQLLGLLVQNTKELASVAEIFVGKMPGQNTPATTTQSTIEQGMKLFTAIFKRVYRSFSLELRKMYRLNYLYIDAEKYQDILDNPASVQDYQGSKNDVVPAADPNAISDTTKQAKAERLLNMLQTGVLDVNEVVKRALEADAQPDIENLFNKQPPQPDPKAQEMQAKMQMEQQKHQMNMQASQAEMQAQMQLMQATIQLEQQKVELEKVKLQIEVQKAQQMGAIKQQEGEQKLQLEAMKGQQKLAQGQQQHVAKMIQQGEAQKLNANQ